MDRNIPVLSESAVPRVSRAACTHSTAYLVPSSLLAADARCYAN